MIIGNGDIASILNDRDGALFFASGVSNSGLNDWNEFRREEELLLAQPKELCLFYFSTISICTHSTPYTVHKLQMELLVKENFKNYNIIRLGNITWGKNPNTFLNKLRYRIENKLPYEIFDEFRYMITKEQLLLLTDNLPLIGKNEISVFGKMRKVRELL